MKKILAILLSVVAMSAQAATYYRDRFVPTGPACLIYLKDRHVNVNMIKSVFRGEVNYTRYAGFWAGYEYYPVQVTRITLINGDVIDFSDGDLKAHEEDALNKIKTCQ